jgi:hypothetical protein
MLMRSDQCDRCLANRNRQTVPGGDPALQISVKRRQDMTIETARMQRPCSARGLAFDATIVAVYG